MENGDCMGIALDIARPETSIVDPTKLVIKKIIPTFMSGDGFLDSTVFKMGEDDEAHGGFGREAKGNLATGLGREKISGILPLYLFKEHWDIARRKAGPILGFMCTLDVMGYSMTQF
jgi:hypothetical protein